MRKAVGKSRHRCSNAPAPLLCCTAACTSIAAQQPTGRTACVGCAASTNITASSPNNWFSRACYSRSSLRDMPRLALMVNAVLPPNPCPDLAGRTRQGRGDPGFQSVPLLGRPPTGSALITEARQTLDPVFLIQPIRLWCKSVAQTSASPMRVETSGCQHRVPNCGRSSTLNRQTAQSELGFCQGSRQRRRNE